MASPTTSPEDFSALPMGSKTQNDVLRLENAKLTREKVTLGDHNTKLKTELHNLRNELSKAKSEIESLKSAQPAQPPPPPPKQAPSAQGEKRKHAAEEPSEPHAKRAKFGVPGGNAPPPSSPMPKPTAAPFGAPPSPPKFPSFGGAASSGFGAFTSSAPKVPSFAAKTPYASSRAAPPLPPLPSSFSARKAPTKPAQAPPAVPKDSPFSTAKIPGIGKGAPDFHSRCITWSAVCKTTFAKAKESGVLLEIDFPEPPFETCSHPGCGEKNKGRVLRACEHVVAKAFTEVMGAMEGDESKVKFLFKQMGVWHPDANRRFACGNVGLAARLDRKFGEVFGVVSGMRDSLSVKEKWVPEEAKRERAL